ncbi:hypothetical protein OA418_00305 [Candidatus Pelagibacter sp.]|nr:hypothetical protein [Candidatus Pelagibacter sp.]
MSKSNSFVKNLKNINRTINSLLEKNLNKLKFDNLINLARSNKIVLTFVALSFLFLTYLLVPTFYKQAEISQGIKKELYKTLNLNLNFPENLKYNFFPRPHFTSNNTYIISDQSKISEIEEIEIYVSLENLFSLKNLQINEVIFKNANFNLNKNNSNFFTKLLDNNFTDKKLKIKNSNIFFRNLEEEVLFINKIINMKYYYEPNELKNIIYAENEVFNTPYDIELYNNKEEKKYYSKLNVGFFNLQIQNQYSYNDETRGGLVTFYINKKKNIVNYKKKENLFEFNLFDKLENPNFSYVGKVNLKPFDSNFQGRADKLNLSYLFNINAIIPQLLKTEIFNNKNIEFKLNINANKISNFNNFVNMILNAKIQGGLVDIDGTSFDWKDYASFKFYESLIHIKKGELFLDGKSQIIINDHNNIYKFLVTPKNFRKKIKTITLNYSYNFDQKIIKIEDIKIDNVFSEKVNIIINDIAIKNNDLQNKIFLKNLVNEALKSYAG